MTTTLADLAALLQTLFTTDATDAARLTMPGAQEEAPFLLMV